MVSVGVTDVGKCLEAQIEEIEVLCSIYGDDWKTENEGDRSYNMEIKEAGFTVTLYVTLPDTYPYKSPPTYILLAPEIDGRQKVILGNQLDEVYLQNIGQPVLFQWIDKIKEFLSSLESSSATPQDSLETAADDCKAPVVEATVSSIEICHGEQITDRKSTFQGHAATVLSINDVRQVLNELQKNKKIAKATHNIYAYRICHGGNNFIQDCDDDGEVNAGGRLLHLLQILNARNVLVVVSRWYGGILLGPVRFQHINNAARQVLEQAGLLNETKKKT
ncbi:hypothetical protein RUM44_003663 [Polyplax serrata]|uniref:RWD domain-containing protein n=1 Tax=Polyplax serrata TaxID=468196 RepID=A0ABR1AH37_POLSC